MKYSRRNILTFISSVLFVAAAATLLPTPAVAEKAGPETLEKLSRAGGLEKHPDANAVVVEDRREVSFNEDGTYLDRSYALVRILTEPGKKEYGEVGLGYSRKYDALRIEFARVVKPDGTVIEVPDEMIKDVTHPALARMNIYDADVRVKMITFKNLEVGDAVEYAVVDSCFMAPIKGHYDLIELFQGMNPVVYKRVEIEGPASKPLKYELKDGEAEFSKSERPGGRVCWLWEVRDVPRIVSEPAMPSPLSFAPRLLVSTIGSWEEISRWWSEMTGRFREPNDSLRAVAAEITQGLATDEEKIKAVYHFVAQKIRYMGLGTGKKAGFEPKPATETLATRYGVCRDVAVLMCTMLDVLDIESYTVLTRAGETVDSEVPTLGFNHAIVAIPDSRGGYYFCDPTVENNVDLLLSAEAGASMLVCTSRGEGLSESAHSPAEDNMGTISARSRIDGQGRLLSEVTINTVGIYDLAFRGWCKNFPPRQLTMIWQQIVTKVHPGARLTGFSTSDTEDLDTPFSLRFSYEVDEYALQAGDYLLVKSPVSTNSFELMLQNFLAAAALPSRNYPFRMGITLGSAQEEELTLPVGYKVKSLPDAVDLECGSLTYRMGYTSSAPDENQPELKVLYSKRFLIDSKELDTESYLELKDILRTSSRSGRGEIILVRE
ncbi:MAG: DUF3857 and transglutaminase domain-containing protein [Gemmatimonadota bacterium]|nr:DUF3857 and transglutaminase domain-containing protein [Gemmatimonadota bacterium]